MSKTSPAPAAGFNREEKARYSRHLILPEVGEAGQYRLKQASVLVVGAGGLGSPSALYLAAAGIGCIGLMDYDKIELTNLQRQILYTTAEVGRSKTDCARSRLLALNDQIKVETHAEKLSAANAASIIKQYDIVLDGSDNFSTRYLVNDACVLAGKPNVYGSIYRFEGQASIFHPPHGPCYRCLFPQPPAPDAVPNCAEGGVLGVLAGTIGVLQATEAIKWILGVGTSLLGRLLIYDAMDMRFDAFALTRNPDCPLCGNQPTIKTLTDVAVSCASGSAGSEISAAELQKLLANETDITLLDVRTAEEFAQCQLANAVLIPLAELPARLSALNRQARIVVYCRSGMRSQRAADLLRDHGFANVASLAGGLLKWQQEVDASLPLF